MQGIREASRMGDVAVSTYSAVGAVFSFHLPLFGFRPASGTFPIFDPSDTSMGDHSFVQLPVYTYMRNVPVAYDRASSPAKRGS